MITSHVRTTPENGPKETAHSKFGHILWIWKCPSTIGQVLWNSKCWGRMSDTRHMIHDTILHDRLIQLDQWYIWSWRVITYLIRWIRWGWVLVKYPCLLIQMRYLVLLLCIIHHENTLKLWVMCPAVLERWAEKYLNQNTSYNNREPPIRESTRGSEKCICWLHVSVYMSMRSETGKAREEIEKDCEREGEKKREIWV